METVTGTTVGGLGSGLSGDKAAGKDALALVLLWSVDQPHRAGEAVLFLRSGDSVLLGRGPSQPGDEAPRAAFIRQRPGKNEATAPLESPRVSRSQLLITRKGASLELENRGRAKLLFAGAEVDQCTLTDGQVVSVRNQLVFLCVKRSLLAFAETASGASPDSTHRFGQPDTDGLVGESPAAWHLRGRAHFVAQREQHVLLLGESGTGKELVARSIHARSRRRGRTLVSRNAATIPEGLFDAELFGNIRDYPNPGMKERPGMVGEADGGTLFLDEIGELPEKMQTHLLRVLDQDGEYNRLGESRARRSDLRFVGATNRSTDALKHDFVARFVVRVELPSLNERREDICLIIRHLLRRLVQRDPGLKERFFSEVDGQLHPRIAPELVEALTTHQYTTHVRELETLLWSAITSSSDQWLRLTPEVSAVLAPVTPAAATSFEEVTKEQLLAALERHNQVQSKVWRELGLKNRYVLRRLLKKFDIEGGETGATGEITID